MRPNWYDDHTDRQQRDVDLGDRIIDRERRTAFERRLLSDEAARNRRLEDDEERRVGSVFEDDPMEMDDGPYAVRWPD